MFLIFKYFPQITFDHRPLCNVTQMQNARFLVPKKFCIEYRDNRFRQEKSNYRLPIKDVGNKFMENI